MDVPQETLLSLLELVSFFNCKDTDSGEFVETRWLTQEPVTHMKSWVDGNFAEQLFEMIEDKNATAYGALIQGMAKVRKTTSDWSSTDRSGDSNEMATFHYEY